MSSFIHEIWESIKRDFQPLTIVYNYEGFLAHPEVKEEIEKISGKKTISGSSLELRIFYELNLRRNPGDKVIYVITQGEVLPDIAIKANIVRFKITDLFPNYQDKQTISSLHFEVLQKLYEKKIQGLVSAERLQILIDDVNKAAEPFSFIGDSWTLFNEIENPDWNDVNTIKSISNLFVSVIDAEKYAEVEQHLKDLNFDFQHYLDDTYWNNLNSNPFLRPQSVAGIIPHIKDNYTSADKIALVVVDGMAFWQYEILRKTLEEIKIFPKEENWLYSWIPSITALSRQAIFRGEAPLFDYVQSPQSEQKLWLAHWNASLSPEYIYEKENVSANRHCKRLAYVTTALDEKMHSSSSYKDLLDLTKNWAKDFAKTIDQLKHLGFTILLTTDHGNVLANGWRPFTTTEKVQLYGKMSRGHRSAIFMNETGALEFQQDLGYSVSTMHRDSWFAIRENQSFTTNGKKEITHGGSHLFEVMIPFIKI